MLLHPHFHHHKVPAPWVLLRHLRPPVFFFPTQGVLKEGGTRRPAPAWLPPPCPPLSFINMVLGCASSIPHLPWPRRGELLLSSLPSHSRQEWDPRSGLPNVPLFFPSVLRCMTEVLPGRHVLQNSGFLFNVSLSGQDTRQVAAPVASVTQPSLAACAMKFGEGAPLFYFRQPRTAAGPPACHQLLQILHLHTSHILRFSSLPSLVPHLSSQEANPSQVIAPFARSTASQHESSLCAHLTEHAVCRTTRT